MGWFPRGTEEEITCRHQHIQKNNPEEEIAEEEEKRRAYEEDGEDATGTYEKPENQEMEEEVTYNVRGDKDQADEWRARGKRKIQPKEDREGDAFEHIGEDPNKEC
ncbi:hypothetical protein NDU88_000088 [Pleurodeles waltl]|uniref:Uncharacterized protein n=1 Tax=Pleurodeles waltl TaxID=8319 RepID=A0AAV7UQP1_PLEWA|nr:hypothetical protein NDU88_000088 [Pleurodeles waltl]